MHIIFSLLFVNNNVALMNNNFFFFNFRNTHKEEIPLFFFLRENVFSI